MVVNRAYMIASVPSVVVAPVVYNALYDVARRPGNRLPVGAA